MSELFFDMKTPGVETPGENGKISTESMEPTLALAAARRAEERRARMSPPGALGLPPLLEARRLEYGIVDAVFQRQPLYDRIILYQFDPFMSSDGKLQGSELYVPDAIQDKEQKSASSGILCGWGPSAQETMASNGVQLGDKVELVRMTPWSIRVDYFASAWEWVLIMRAGDLVTSVDLADRLRKGECKIAYNEDAGRVHVTNPDGERWVPEVPKIAGEY